MRQPSADLVSLFGPTIERILRAEGVDFLRELSHLVVEGWLRNGRIAPFVGDMVNESARRRGWYLDRLRREHRELLALSDHRLRPLCRPNDPNEEPSRSKTHSPDTP
jgi:hypothetical protein